jgi:hypothetical protein
MAHIQERQAFEGSITNSPFRGVNIFFALGAFNAGLCFGGINENR